VADDKQSRDVARDEQEQQAAPAQPAQQPTQQPAQPAEQDEENLSALGPYVAPGQSEPEPLEPGGDAATAVEPMTDDDLQGE
jgi:hypothetical protein